MERLFGSTSKRVWYPEANPSQLTEIEIASGIVLGRGDSAGFERDNRADPTTVLRGRARELLAKPPCVVAFSGGRDSSALLAILVDVARKEGLEEPVAVTARWDGDAASDESSWQEQVINTVKAKHWEIIRPGTDLDLLGNEATNVLRNLGLMWPAPTYAFLPMIRIAKGGVFISGEGGDEAFGLWPYGRLWSTIRRGKLPRFGDLRALALGCMPSGLRRRRWRHNLPPYQHWLRPTAFRQVAEALAEEMAGDPLRWDRYQFVSRSLRSTEISLQTFEAICALEGSNYAGPFLDEPFRASLARWGGRLGRGDRTAVMTELFSDVLPDPVLARRSKASFGGVFWGPASRAFAESWDGSGLDADLVDAQALRHEWLAPVPVYGSALPLQAAWLFSYLKDSDRSERR